jgi:hypothetical protein
LRRLNQALEDMPEGINFESCEQFFLSIFLQEVLQILGPPEQADGSVYKYPSLDRQNNFMLTMWIPTEFGVSLLLNKYFRLLD